MINFNFKESKMSSDRNKRDLTNTIYDLRKLKSIEIVDLIKNIISDKVGFEIHIRIITLLFMYFLF